MTIIQKISIFIRKKFNFSLLLETKVLRVQKFNPLIIVAFLIFFTILFFVSSSIIIKNNDKNRDNFEEIIKTNEFKNITNFLISKINSPYQEISYTIQNKDTVEKILKKFKIRNEDIGSQRAWAVRATARIIRTFTETNEA